MSRLASLNDLFGDMNATTENNGSNKSEIDIKLLVPFSKHPFKLYTGPRFDDMVRSIREFGVLQPIIVRPYTLDLDKSEILAGHNRWNAAKEAELKKLPVIIMEGLSDEEAMLVVIETNLLQRSFADLSHSERALVLSEHYETLKSQGRRMDIINKVKMLLNSSEINDDDTCGQVGHKLKTRDQIAKDYNLSSSSVARYIRINSLSNELKQWVDSETISFIAGVELSYLSEDNQIYLVDILNNNNYKVDIKTATELRKLEESSKLNEPTIVRVLEGTYFKNKKTASILSGIKVKLNIMKKYFNDKQSTNEVEEIIDKALEQYYQSNDIS